MAEPFESLPFGPDVDEQLSGQVRYDDSGARAGRAAVFVNPKSSIHKNDGLYRTGFRMCIQNVGVLGDQPAPSPSLADFIPNGFHVDEARVRIVAAGALTHGALLPLGTAGVEE